ncbi:DUF6311 domain-containing protein [Roseococcus sp. YIM B11640]|uniref:DUF6311 domain-containing protein n=1 Tax=Roseococcus sp. YIM B11640 TaxID=3133973 RepID=UPI003C7D13F8
MHFARATTVLGAALAAALGAAIVIHLFGPHILPPSSTGWMLSGQVGPDPVQYWLGWTFFRQAPWGWPPGESPLYGMELSSSIFYADSIPLIALALKALRGVVDVDQYWGLWLAFCGAMQAWLGWRLVGLFTKDVLARVAGAMILVLQPMLLNRMGGHFALSAQWLVLWSLLLVLTPGGRFRPLGWALLVLAASLIHSYILPMVLALWVADWWSRKGVLELALVPAAGLGGLWLAGFFLLGAGHGNAQYGTMQLDLLGPFDPGFWGSLVPDLPDPDHPESGSSYLGLGALLLLPFAFLARPVRRIWPLALVLLAMLAFAISHRVLVGGAEVLHIPLPGALVEKMGALRCSERFFWPLAYALILAGMAGLLRVAGPRWGGLALLALLAVQAVDLRPGYARIAHYFPPTPAELPLRLQDPFWEQAAIRYRAIRAVPAANQGRAWEEIAVFAARHGMATDAIYLARADASAVAGLRRRVAQRLMDSDPEPATLYVLRDEESLEIAREGLRPGRDAIIQADGLNILAPDWDVTASVSLTNPGEMIRTPGEENSHADPTPPRL